MNPELAPDAVLAQPLRDTGYAPDRWAFDAEVTRVFEDMLDRSIPDYAEMRRLTTALGARYVQPKTDIVDLGCSRGGALAPYIEKFGAYNTYCGVEASAPMVEAARARFAKLIDCGLVRIEHCDLRTTWPRCRPSLILSVLTLMFVPLEHRPRVVQHAYDSLTPGGAFLVVEKILGATPPLLDAFVDEYHKLKEHHGYTPAEIARKALALEAQLMPVTATWNEELLRSAGFRQVDCYWRWCNFAAWLAVKD